MKSFATTLALAAFVASTTLVSASTMEQHALPAIARRHTHKRHTKGSCRSHKHHHHHKSANQTNTNAAASSQSEASAQSQSQSQTAANVQSDAKTKSQSQSGSGSGSDSQSQSNASSSSSSNSSSGSSSSSSSSSSSFSGVSGNKKMGLAWANSDGMPISNFDFGDVSWFYSWDATPGWANAPVDQLMYCPMLWGYKSTDSFRQNVLNNLDAKANQHKCAMAMNEVNQQGQSLMSAEQGCQLIEEYLLPLKEKGWYLMGPSTTNAPDGKTWYQNFQKACPDTFNKLDSIAIHYYGTSSDDFKQYLQDWHTTFGKDLWVTEFACQNFSGGAQCNSDQTNAFASTMADFMNSQDWVKGWAPFAVIQNLQGVSETQRLSNGNNPTNLFRLYAGAN